MRKIVAADYLIELLINKGIKDVFGYQGGMVCHIFDSLGKYSDIIRFHQCGNEQGAAFAACGYAQSTGNIGIVITTSGPGFTNALTGLASAWFDSVPVVLISGQVNTKDKRRGLTLRQYGFQEIQALSMAEPVVKRSYEIDLESDIEGIINDALSTATEARKGPVYIDFPINMQRELITLYQHTGCQIIRQTSLQSGIDIAGHMAGLMTASRPIIIAGAGISQAGMRNDFRRLVRHINIPVITTMPGIDLIPTTDPCFVGYLGGTARREAGIVLQHTDFVLSLGTRLCNKSIGYHHHQFIPNAKKLIRIDIDRSEFERSLKDCEEDIQADLRDYIPAALRYTQNRQIYHSKWMNDVQKIRNLLAKSDITVGNTLINTLSRYFADDANVTLDVGNNLVYSAQSLVIKNATRVFLSSGLGSMGYSVPAAIGAAIGTNRITYAITGDGGAQMNVQELNVIAKKNLPIKVIVLNNRALGHIVLFQEHYLDNRYVGTMESNRDYYSCDFSAIGRAYGLRSFKLSSVDEINAITDMLLDPEPLLIEFDLNTGTLLPNIHGGLDPLTNGPELDEDIKQNLMDLFRNR